MIDKNGKDVVWWAVFRYGKPNLSKITVEKRTKKLIYVEKEVSILGLRCSKERLDGYDKTFESPNEAILYLISETEKHMLQLARAIKDCEKSTKTLRGVLRRLDEQQSVDGEEK